MSVSYKTSGTSYDELLSFTPDAGIITAKNVYIFQLPFGVLLLILVAFCGTLLWQFCNSSYFVSYYPHFTKMKRFKLVVWLLQLISSITCLIVLFTVLKPCVLWNGTLFPGVVSGELDLDWNYQVSWLETLDDLWVFLGWGIFPSLFVYIFEITPIGPYAPRSAIHLHHFTVILTVLYGIKAFVSTYDATWIQMGITLYFHIILEIPIWLALLAYRLESKNAAFYLGLATAYEAGLRLVLWISGFLIYAKLCWLRFTYTPWEVIWRIAFPIICIMLMGAQVVTIKIHYYLYCHVAKKQALEGSKTTTSTEKDVEMTDNHFVTTSSTAADSIEMGKSNDEGDDATLPATRRNSEDFDYADIYPNSKNTEIAKEERKVAIEKSSFFYQNHLTMTSNNASSSAATTIGGGGKQYEKLALDSPTSSYRSSPVSSKDRKKLLRVSWSDSKDDNDSPTTVTEMRSLSPEKPGSFVNKGKMFPVIMVNKIDEEEKDGGVGSGSEGEETSSPPPQLSSLRKARSESEDSNSLNHLSPVSSVYYRSTDELLRSFDDSANPKALTIETEGMNNGKKADNITNRVPLNVHSFDSYYGHAQSMSIDLEAGGKRQPLQRQFSQDSNFSTSFRSIRSLGSMRFDSFFIQEGQPSSGSKGKGEPTKQRTAFFGIKTNTLTYWFLYGFYIPFFIILFGTALFTSNVGYYSEVSSGQRIAIIGGGITGLGATWSLSKHPESFSKITLFESQETLGGNAQSYYYHDPITGKQESFIDQGFSQFNSHYSNLLMLFKHLNQTTLLNYVYFTGVLPNIDEIPEGNDIHTSESGELLSLGRSFFRNSTLSTTYMSEINRLSSLLDDILQGWNEKELMTTTLGHFLATNEFSDGFTFRYMPICLNLYVASSVGMFDIPIMLFYYMETVFKACLTSSPVPGRHLGNGTTAYIDALVKDIYQNNHQNQIEIRTKTSIQAIQINNPKSLTSKGTVKILSSDGKWTEYDQIIFATYRKNIYNIFHHPESKVCPDSDYLMDSSTCESLYNSLFDNHAESGSALYSIVHNDTNYMKNVFGRLQDQEGCWNYQHYNFYSLMNYTNPSDLTSNTASSNSIHMQLPYTSEEPMLSYCQDEPKPPFLLHTHVPYTSLNPSLQVDSTKILNSKSWYHNNHNSAFFGKTRNNYLVQGLHNMWYAGVDFTLNFHEHALVSGLIIAHKLGAGYPFQNDALAKGTFINYRNWMLYGLNPLIPPTTNRGHLKPQNQQ
jgi:predicted NAD/FAD-binding protein